MIDEKRWQALARAVRREVVRRFPAWTGGNAGDPGITLMELFAFLAENQLFRPIAARERIALARSLASAAAVLAAAGAGRRPRDEDGLVRNNYFFGKLLDVDDFTAEQDYIREKFRRHNRRLHGWGTVTGLGVSIPRGAGGAKAVVSPGFALDRLGEEIDVPRRLSLPLPTKGGALFVLLRYAERPCRAVPVPGSVKRIRSRIEETFEASIAPAAGADAVPIARLTRATGAWQLDRRFQPPRALR